MSVGRQLRAGLAELEAAIDTAERVFKQPDPRLLDVDRRREYRRLVAHRLEHLVAVDQPLVLISQIQRSGGTLLAQLLDGHPQLHAYPPELGIGHPKQSVWPELDLSADPDDWFEILAEPSLSKRWGAGGSYSNSPMKKRFPAEVERFSFLLPPLLQESIFKALVEGREISSARDVLDCYMTSYFNAWLDNRNLLNEDKRWVSGFVPGVPVAKHSLRRFFSDYPDGRLISIVRDPRSWYASALGQREVEDTKRLHRRYRSIEKSIELWKGSVGSTIKAQARFGERVLILSFEELVSETERTISRLAAYLEVDTHGSLLTPSFNGRPIRADSSFRVRSHGVISDPLSRYREVLPAAEIAYIEEVALPLYEEALTLRRC